MSNPLAQLAAYCLNSPPPPREGTGRTLETLAGRFRDAFQTLREASSIIASERLRTRALLDAVEAHPWSTAPDYAEVFAEGLSEALLACDALEDALVERSVDACDEARIHAARAQERAGQVEEAVRETRETCPLVA
jgi:hypothetical protein